MHEQPIIALLAAAVLAVVHVLGGQMRFLDGIPRSRWLSAFAGVSVAYVFVHLLPELAEGQRAIDGEHAGEAAGPLPAFLEDHVYLMALGGLIVFYGVELHSVTSRRAHMSRRGEDRTEQDAFWLSVGSFGVYNAVVGYLLVRGELDEPTALALFTFALGVHFVINDLALREHHKDGYDRIGRWIVSAGVLVGCLVGIATAIPERAIALVIAFIAGGVVLNVLKEELPVERRARLMPFIGGAAAYSAVLQLI